ncbi:MAG: hypothetical protein JST68_14265 [Bacteroidetes bacterium]|nr:hypothetical protein [Bacteroidota bacterium]
MKRADLYATIRPLFDQKEIQSFRDIFLYVSGTVFAADLGKRTDRFKELIEHVDEFTVEEIVLMGGLVRLSLMEMLTLIIPNYPTDKLSSPEKKNISYKAVWAMYNEGQVESFTDIFKYIKVAIVAKDIRKNRSTLSSSLKASIKKFPLGTLAAIGSLCNLTLKETFELIDAEYTRQTQKSSLNSE